MKLLIFATALIALPGLALAGDCSAESGLSVASILGTTCTIGNLSFTFDSYNPGGYDSSGGAGDQAVYDGSAVTFALTSDGDGFKLSGSFSSSNTTTLSASGGSGTLGYHVQVLDGTLTGLTTTINGSLVSISSPPTVPPPPPDTINTSGYYSYDYAYTDALNDLDLIPNNAAAEISPFAEQILEDNGTLDPIDTETDTATTEGGSTSYGSTPGIGLSASDIAGFSGVSPSAGYIYGTATISTDAENGFAAYSCNCFDGFGAGGTSSASFTEADFDFDVTGVPESSPLWSLLAMGALMILPIRRLRRGPSA